MALHPNIWFELQLAKVPTSEGTTVYRWAPQPFADEGSWKEGRLIAVGQIERAASDRDGNYELSKLRVTVTDHDATIRSLLASSTTQYFSGREAGLYLLSPAGRAAGLDPRVLFRGRVSDVQLLPDRRVSIEVRDLVGSEFSKFNLDKTIPAATITLDEHPNAPEQSLGKVYPIIVGEHNDVGSLDANGAAADKGLIPVIDTGDYDLTGSSSPPEYADPPTNVSGAVVGAGGDETYYYAFTVITPYGESVLSDVVTVTGCPSPAQMSVSNYVEISCEAPTGYFVRVWGRGYNPPIAWLDGAQDLGDGTFTYYDGAAHPPSPTRDELDVEKFMAPPQISTALVSDTVWGRLVVALGSVNVLSVYASDLASGSAPKRVQLDASLDGVEFLTSNSVAWPHADPYVEINGIRMTVIYLRGPRLTHHREGAVTIAVNVCGAEDVGDGSGDMIDEAFPALQWMLNEHVLKNGGTGYRSGNWGPLETYANGDAQLKTTVFAAAQAVTVTRIGGAGYLAAWAICEPITVREFVRRFCQSFDCHLAVNHHGQLFPFLIDDTANPATGRLFRDRIEVISLEDQNFAHREVENRLTYSYDWDADAKAYRVREQVLEDEDSIAAHSPGADPGDTDRRGVRQGRTHELFCVRDPETADDTRSRRLALYTQAPRYVTFRCDLMGLEYEPGDQIRLTHYDGLGASGDVETPLVILRHATDIDRGQVTLTALDVGPLLLSDLGGGDAVMASRGSQTTYTEASESEQAQYLFLADRTTGEFSNGDPAQTMGSRP